MSVFDFLKQNGFQPFPQKHIRDFASHLLKSVQCELPSCPIADQMYQEERALIHVVVHRLRLIHTDLKPENILLVSNDAYMIGARVS